MTNQLISLRSNIFYQHVEEKEELQKYFEVILLTDFPKYIRSNAGEMVRERVVDQLRFTCDPDQLRQIGEVFIKMSDSTEKDYEL